MKKMISLFVLALFALAAMPSFASAQGYYDYVRSHPSGSSRYRTGGLGDRGFGRGRYNDPYLDLQRRELQDFLKTPGILGSCRLGMSSRNPERQVAADCHWLTRNTMEALMEHLQMYPTETYMLGTQHAEKEKGVVSMHFRPYDPSNSRVTTLGGAGLGAAGGVAIGAGIGGRRGAAIGGAIGAFGGGVAAAAKGHNNCLPIEVQSRPATVAELSEPQHVERGESGPTQVVKQGGFELYNSTRVYVDAYDGSTLLRRLNPGERLVVGPPASQYRGESVVPQENGRLEKVELCIKARPTGWIFVEPPPAVQ